MDAQKQRCTGCTVIEKLFLGFSFLRRPGFFLPRGHAQERQCLGKFPALLSVSKIIPLLMYVNGEINSLIG